jgi:hypothetical protein
MSNVSRHMRTVRLHLTSQDESEHHEVVLLFEQPQLMALTQFLANCDRLARARIFCSGFPTVSNVSMTATEGMIIKVSDFDYGEVCELLHLARPIFLTQEPASFENTQAIFGRQSRGNALRRHLRYLRELYERGDYQPYFQVSIGDTPLFHETAVRAWLNGVEYHQDKDKAAVVASLEQSLTTNGARGVFVAQLSGRIRATFLLAELARLVVSKDDG